MSDAYNYAHFPLDLDGPLFAAFPQLLRVGTQAPDGELIRLDDDDGARVRLSEYWRARPVIIEFGSVT
jgi:hypothetical protein